MIVQGVSTRKVAAICRELFGDEMSHQTVSQYVQRLDEELEPWRTRPLECEHPYVFLDARYEKVRVEHRVVDMAVLVAIGVNADGRREVPGVEVAHGESKATWGAFLGSLLGRGLKRRSRVVRIFPNRASCVRLAAALLKEWHEDWVTGRRYLRMESLAEWTPDHHGESDRTLGAAA